MRELLSRRQQRVLLGTFVTLLYLQQEAHAQDPFDCHVALDDTHNFDLTTVAGEHVVTRSRDTPPSRMSDEVRFDLCADLSRRDGVADGDQCPSGARACMTMTNQKDNENDRVIAAIPLAVSSSLNPQTSIIPSPNKGLNLVFSGGEYPKTDPIPQTFNISLYCDTTSSDPNFVSYNGAQLRVEWKTPAGCAFDASDPSKGGNKDTEGGNDGEEHVGSGVGWFFLLNLKLRLLIAFLAYFILGAYYNYSTYGATGADLIPHRDFWREVPYILRDIGSHLCSALRPSPRNGYIAV
ncbi:uncharacterized protein FOMMEDRAFT_28851 [Fomitiporia mediterranea MF3/22]|uniref:uncharacterized protein n=1 Tax=Fomitiporia mediterranea (strain MF3/22) TaxID=694068 RepID=UPI0004407FFC|nr:uncharacterized protein FOMMEDRAFT_28851 [Fomitiporia mediterranea MF3/22]EJD03336.1 hypothetical protein FOMMEDRAFT_28851 [Fomitiporia mediterranea MF3/22]